MFSLYFLSLSLLLFHLVIIFNFCSYFITHNVLFFSLLFRVLLWICIGGPFLLAINRRVRFKLIRNFAQNSMVSVWIVYLCKRVSVFCSTACQYGCVYVCVWVYVCLCSRVFVCFLVWNKFNGVTSTHFIEWTAIYSRSIKIPLFNEKYTLLFLSVPSWDLYAIGIMCNVVACANRILKLDRI